MTKPAQKLQKKQNAPEHGWSRQSTRNEDNPDKLLRKAARCDDIKALRKALEAGANPNYRDCDQWTPLMHAITRDSRQAFEALLPITEIQNRPTRPSNTPLMHAIRANKLHFAKALLPLSMLSDDSQNGVTALMLAAASPNEAMLDLLLEAAGPQHIRKQDRYGNDAAKHAACADNAKGLRKLIERGANLEAENCDGLTLLLAALQYKAARASLYLLTETGCDLSAKDRRGNSALIHAAKTQNKKLIDLALPHCSVALQDAYGHNVFDALADADRHDLIAFILERPFRIDRNEFKIFAEWADRASSAKRVSGTEYVQKIFAAVEARQLSQLPAPAEPRAPKRGL